jgi:WD40 repeat protein
LIDDCERKFVLWFFNPIEASALHIYHSALPWSPTSSPTRGAYQSQLTTEAKAVDTTWDACIRTIPVYDDVHKEVFSHDDALTAVLTVNRMKILDDVTGSCLATFDTQRSTYSAAFSHDDNLLGSGLSDGTLNVFDVQTGDLIQTFQRHPETVTSVAFSLSDDDDSSFMSWFMSLFSDRTVSVSDVQTPDLTQEFQGHTDAVNSIAFSPCGTMIASSARLGKCILIWNVSSGSRECCLNGHSDTARAVCWSAQGNKVVSGSNDTTIRIWDVARRTCSSIIRRHTKAVTCVDSFQDFVASGSLDGTVKIFDLQSGDVLQTISPDEQVQYRYRWIDSVQFFTLGDKMMYTNGKSAYT